MIERAMDPLVSIITPTFNHGPFIGRCIRSVLGQTFTGWEQIIIDDGSTDNTAALIKAFKDSRIKYVYQENRGIFRLAGTYNRAVGMAKGKFIAILEGDDFWPDNKLEAQLPLFGSGCILSWGSVRMTDKNGKPIGIKPACGRKAPDLNGNPFNYLIKSNIIPAVSVMVRKDALLAVGGFQQVAGVPCVDYPTWLTLAGKGRFCFGNWILGCWRTHDSQVTSMQWDTDVVRKMNGYRLSVFDNLGPEQRKELNLSREDVLKNNRKLMAYNNFRQGRIELLRSNREKGRSFMKESLRTGTVKLRVRSAWGILSSYIHMNIDSGTKTSD